MSKRGALRMTTAEFAAHQARHGFGDKNAITMPLLSETKSVLPVGPKMTIPEKEYAMILEAQKRDGKILEYRPWGIKLAWGADPKTGKAMIYTPDFYVVKAAFRQNPYISDIVLVEVKGSELHQSALVRFKGARACWPMFNFELHQRSGDGTWRHVL